MITLSKIAKLAHVSISTVSKAFSMSNEVNEKTREMIFDIARQNNCFREYFNAKYPKYVVAIVCPEFDSTYYASTLSLIQQNLAKYNCEITVASTNFSVETERELLEYYSKYTTVDAIINYGSLTEKAIKSEIPIINMLGTNDKRNCICHDYANALDCAVKHFIKTGAKKIGYISEKRTRQKYESFCDALKNNSLPLCEKYVVITDERFEKSGYLGMEALFKSGELPEAVICGYDDIALGVMRCVLDKGLKVPDDIMVMGMNDISVSAYSEPRLSSISLNNELTCKAATDMLMSRLTGESYPDNAVIECELKLRKSTERPKIK